MQLQQIRRHDAEIIFVQVVQTNLPPARSLLDANQRTPLENRENEPPSVFAQSGPSSPESEYRSLGHYDPGAKHGKVEVKVGGQWFRLA
jgi:hypothetical protein